MITISELYIYPIKSARRIELEESTIEPMGFKYDRNFAVLSAERRILTARENPKLFDISTQVNDSSLILSCKDKGQIELELKHKQGIHFEMAHIFKDEVSTVVFQNKEVHQWISEVLGEEARLITIDQGRLRPMRAKYNGKEGDFIGFKDGAAIHLISEASVQELNSRLENAVTTKHFRPNIVVNGIQAYEEESWKMIKIGDCLFEVAVKTGRCQITTIDPETVDIDQNQEPLRTLSTFKKEGNSTKFGIYLIPRKLGQIQRGAEVEVID